MKISLKRLSTVQRWFDRAINGDAKVLRESIGLLDMPLFENVKGQVGAEPIETLPHFVLFKGRSIAEAQSHV